MTLYDRYLLKRLIGTMLRTMLSLVFIFILIDLATNRRDNIAHYDIPLPMVALYYLTYIPTILFEYQVAALSVLVAGLMVFGRAAQDEEITALRASGVGLRRLARWPIILAALTAVGAFYASDHLGAQATKTSKAIESKYFSRFTGNNREGVSWNHLSGGWACHVLKFNRLALTGQDVYIHRIREDRVDEIRADRIWWDPASSRWIIEDGRHFWFDPNEGMSRNVFPITQSVAPFTEPPEMLFALSAPPGTKTAEELRVDLVRAEQLGTPVQHHWVQYHIKFARPALCFIMIWLAIPFAIRMRRGGLAVGFGLSIALAIAYMLTFYAAVGLGTLGELTPAVAAWFANGVFFLLGAGMFYRASA